MIRLTYGRGKAKARLDVLVFPTLEKMREYAGVKQAYGACRSISAGLSRAEIILCKQYLTPYYISHECVHAAYAFGRRGLNPWEADFSDEEEERVAYPVGQFTWDIINELKKRELMK